MLLGEWLVGKHWVAWQKRRAARKGEPFQEGMALEFVPGALSEFRKFAHATFLTRFPDREVAGRLATSLIDPAGAVTRISEDVEFGRAAFVVRTAMSFFRPQRGVGFIAPILRVPKGVLVDNLSITVDGARVSTLSYVEAHGATIAALVGSFRTLFQGEGEDVLNAILDDSADQRPKSPTNILNDLDRLRGERGISGSDAIIYAGLRGLVRFCYENYYVFVPAAAGDSTTVRVVVEHTIQQRAQFGEPRTQHSGAWPPRVAAAFGRLWNQQPGRWNRLRVATGLEARSYFVPLLPATESSSYHMQAKAPAGMYVFNASLHPFALLTDRQLAAHSRRSLTEQPRAELSDSLGLDYIHAYTRDLDGHLSDLVGHRGEVPRGEEQQLALGLDVEFRERPPGILIGVVVLSLFLLSLAIAVGHFHDEVFHSTTQLAKAGSQTASSKATAANSSDTNTASNTALLFGIPALLAGWLAVRVNGAILRRISFPTAMVTLWFIGNACFAVFLAGLKEYQTRTTMWDLGPFHFRHVTWVLLTLSAAANAGTAIVIWANRTIRYVRRLRYGANCLDTGRRSV